MGFDIQKMMKQAQKMQEQMATLQEQLGDMEVTGSAGGGAVSVKADGRGDIKSIKIAPEAMDDRETLEDLVLAAVKDAMTKANDLTQEKMSGITNGVKIPGMPF